jgi:hypothetical protein
MSATTRRAWVCRSQFLFVVVQWATVGVTSKQVKRPEIDFCRPRRSPRFLAHVGAATTDRCAKLSARRPAIARG